MTAEPESTRSAARPRSRRRSGFGGHHYRAHVSGRRARGARAGTARLRPTPGHDAGLLQHRARRAPSPLARAAAEQHDHVPAAVPGLASSDASASGSSRRRSADRAAPPLPSGSGRLRCPRCRRRAAVASPDSVVIEAANVIDEGPDSRPPTCRARCPRAERGRCSSPLAIATTNAVALLGELVHEAHDLGALAGLADDDGEGPRR